MKVQLVCLLLVLLCVSQVFTLQCYVCAGSDEQDCKNLVECPSSAQYCKSVASGGNMNRMCADTCEEDDYTTCCDEDGCA